MIFRKPYAFLIKNFRKIHIFLLVLCAYIFFKNSQLRSFISEFINLGTYNMYEEPISKYVNILVIVSLLIITILSITLVVLLKKKNKPWKLYLLPVFTYSFMLIMMIITTSYFNNYTGSEGTAGIRAIRDLLLITYVLQFPVFIILIIRIFGIDLNNFNFKMDQEYLDLSSEDREEFEININVDKHSFIRGYKRVLRNLGYVYEEHKFIVTTLGTILLVLFIGYSYYNIFIVHRSYKQGDNMKINYYTIRVNDSYYTSRNYKGDIISKSNNFVILDVDLKNDTAKRKINFGRFHIMNGVKDYKYTYKTYESDFKDLGKTYEAKEINSGEKIHLIMIFKVDKKLNPDRFVLYYQDYVKGKPYLRKIKLRINDLSKINNNKEVKKGNDLVIKEGKKEKAFNVESMKLKDSINYSYTKCGIDDDCDVGVDSVNAGPNRKIMEIEFTSDDFEGKELIDFSSKYGKINYIDNNKKEHSLSIKDVVQKDYMGQLLYIDVPKDLESAKNIKLVYTVRNNKYSYKIK